MGEFYPFVSESKVTLSELTPTLAFKISMGYNRVEHRYGRGHCAPKTAPTNQTRISIHADTEPRHQGPLL